MPATTSARPIATDRSVLERYAWALASGILIVPAIVVPAILWARYTFHRLHPDADPSIFLTISRAISDPAVGEPFAVWVTIAAVILWPSTHLILWMFAADHPPRDLLGRRRDLIGRSVLVGLSLAMTASCIGMVVLSNYRLGSGSADHRIHMLGSYTFFAGQAVAILLTATYHSVIAPARRSADVAAFFPPHRRAALGYAIMALAVFYGAIFRVKSMDFGAAQAWVTSAYVELETLLIIIFLAYLTLFYVDAVRFLRTRARRPQALGDAAMGTTA